MSNALLMALPAAVVAGVVAVTSTGTGSPSSPAGARIQLEVAGSMPVPEGSASILVLREKGAKILLPLVVPRAAEEASQHQGPRRGGLLSEAIEALGGRVSEVEIVRAEETPAGSRLRLVQGRRLVELPARPSESIALAIAAGAPIVTTRRVLDEAGVTPEELVHIHAKTRPGARRM